MELNYDLDASELQKGGQKPKRKSPSRAEY